MPTAHTNVRMGRERKGATLDKRGRRVWVLTYICALCGRRDRRLANVMRGRVLYCNGTHRTTRARSAVYRPGAA